MLGDKGAAASFEARYDKEIAKTYLKHIQLYAFYEGGATWNFENIGGVPIKQTALSGGFGARGYVNKWISGDIFLAQPFTKPVTALTEKNQVVVNGVTENRGNGHEPRVFFSATANFG